MVYSKIWTSQQFGHLSPKARLLFIGTITLADDDGRLVGEPSYLRGQIFPYDEIDVQEMKSLKKEVEDSGLILSYEVGNFQYIEHPKWLEYQAIRRDLYKSSTLPPRNGTVTKPLRKSTLSKDKISKDKIINTALQSNADIPLIIDLFKEVNPSYQRLFGSPPQRAAVERLLKVHGKEKLTSMISYLPKSNATKYAPTITTPSQFEAKLGDLIAWSNKQKESTRKIIV